MVIRNRAEKKTTAINGEIDCCLMMESKSIVLAMISVKVAVNLLLLELPIWTYWIMECSTSTLHAVNNLGKPLAYNSFSCLKVYSQPFLLHPLRRI